MHNETEDRTAQGRLMTFGQVLDRMRDATMGAEESHSYTRLEWPSNRHIRVDPGQQIILNCTAGPTDGDETTTAFAPTYEDVMAGDWMEA